MNPARIAALLEPFLEHPLAAQKLEKISTYIDLLLRWNARINLTAIRNPEEIVTRHFGESFFLARHLFPVQRSSSAPLPTAHWPLTTVLDIGSGAGFPAVPLKIWAPHVHVTLVESNHKKAAFLREVIRTLILTNINVITARAETLASNPASRVAVVTARAVERFASLLPVAAGLLAPHGRLALLVGSSQLPTLSAVTPQLNWAPPLPIPESRSRVLAIGTLP